MEGGLRRGYLVATLTPRQQVAARSIASLSLSFGLVSIPIKLYSATESSAAVRFKLMAAGGARLRQQYVADAPAPDSDPDTPAEPEVAGVAAAPRSAGSRVVDFPNARREVAVEQAPSPADTGAIVDRSDLVKGYEFEKGKYVLFTADELKALAEGSRQTIDIVAFIPEHAVDPIYYDKAYFLAPDKRGAKPYHLLLRAMIDTRRCALARWAFRSKEYVVEIRAVDGGMVLQQLLYAEEVRSLADLHIDPVDVGDAELKLATRLIEQISVDRFDPADFVDEERRRILDAVAEKIAGKQIVAPEHVSTPAGAEVVDLVAALRASLRQASPPATVSESAKRSKASPTERKPVKRAAKAAVPAVAEKGRAGKR